jgi:hypothetical protein
MKKKLTWGKIFGYAGICAVVVIMFFIATQYFSSNVPPMGNNAHGAGRGPNPVDVDPPKDPIMPDEFYVQDSNTASHNGELQNNAEKRFVWHQLGLANLTVELDEAGRVKLTQNIEKLLLAVRKERVEKELHQPRHKFDYLLRNGDKVNPDFEKTRMISNHELKLIREYMKDDCPSILGPGPLFHLSWKAARALVAYRKANPQTDDEADDDPPTRVLPIAGDDTEVHTRLTRHGRRDRRGQVNRATDRTRRLRADRSNDRTQERQVNPGPPVVRVRTNYDHNTRVSSDGRNHVVEILSQ